MRIVMDLKEDYLVLGGRKFFGEPYLPSVKNKFWCYVILLGS